MSQLIRAIEEFNIQLLRNLFFEEVEYNESIGFFAWKGKRLTEDQIGNALDCRFRGGEIYSLVRDRCEYPSKEED